jgi:ATP-binding cassette, subfamily C (CFTR/MRP), member 1
LRVRGGCISLIYDSSLSKAAGIDDSKALALISNDIDKVNQSVQLLIDIWSQFLQIVIGVRLLWRQLGAVSIVPLIMILLMFYVQKNVSALMPPTQKLWLEAVQRRVGISKVAIQNFRSVKISGLSESIIDLLQSERERELMLAKGYRWVVTFCKRHFGGSKCRYSPDIICRILTSVSLLGNAAIDSI